MATNEVVIMTGNSVGTFSSGTQYLELIRLASRIGEDGGGRVNQTLLREDEY